AELLLEARDAVAHVGRGRLGVRELPPGTLDVAVALARIRLRSAELRFDTMALGAPARSLAAVLLMEGLGVAVAGLLGGFGIGYLLARLLVSVLNPQVFGWTLAFAMPWSYLGALALVTLLAAACALVPAARWASRLSVDRAAEEGA
ncbi:MAG TPA: FtsX-like permease family protein, partial [Holophagaceae bacterium]|nr:FtsX-like permease family protein [Holophagaceae bacterium]